MRYQYTSSGFRSRLNPSPLILPGGVKFLLIINILVFILTELSGQKHSFFLSFGLVPNMVWSQLQIWQLFTYMFIHGGVFHIVLNMLFLWIIGKDLEMDWGKKDFLVFYFFCGIGAGVITTLINNNSGPYFYLPKLESYKEAKLWNDIFVFAQKVIPNSCFCSKNHPKFKFLLKNHPKFILLL